MFKVASNLSWRQERIEEGLQSSEFLKLVDELLQHELGNTDTSTLMNQLVLDFDTNRDGKVALKSVFLNKLTCVFIYTVR